MKTNKYYKLIMAGISLSLCLFAQNLYADECEDALSKKLSSILRGEVENISIIAGPMTEVPGIMKGYFSFSINGQKREIEIEYRFPLDSTMHLFSQLFGPRLLKTSFLENVLSPIPAKLLEQVNRITVSFTEEADRSSTSKCPYNTEKAYSFVANEISFIISYSRDRITPVSADISPHYNFEFMLCVNFSFKIPHQIGHIIAYHRYGSITPDQQWHNAVLADNPKAIVSEYSGTNMAENFAEAMKLYLIKQAGLDNPDIARSYAHRFEILDGIMGLDFFQRRQITERNRLLEEKIHEINHLLKSLGILDQDGKIYEGIGIIDATLGVIRRVLLNDSDMMIMARVLADKALILHRRKPLNFTSVDDKSLVREKLIRELTWPGLLYLSTTPEVEPIITPEIKSIIPEELLEELVSQLRSFSPTPTTQSVQSFITDATYLLDTLSTHEMQNRLMFFRLLREETE